MRLKQYFLLSICVIVISFILHLSSVFVETAGNKETAENKIDSENKLTITSPDRPDKEDLAKQIFFEIRHVDDPAEKAGLYRRIIDECSGIVLAQEALWRLAELYLDDFDEPNVKEAIACLEQFIRIYPDSEWRSHVEFRLLGLYENEKLWEKMTGLYNKIINENPNMPGSLKDELFKRYGTPRNQEE
jgi:tetratricopeptide (TPR) repeat protein